MSHESVWYSRPRGYGKGARSCRICTHPAGLIRKYGLNICPPIDCWRDEGRYGGHLEERAVVEGYKECDAGSMLEAYGQSGMLD
ncbi:MAG: hypothetical protein Q9175_001564 [Cornicularia normoerica]